MKKDTYIHPIRKTSLHLIPDSIEIPDLLSVKKVKAYPPVQRYAKKLGIDITKITGTGRGGIVTKEDVKRFFDLKRDKEIF